MDAKRNKLNQHNRSLIVNFFMTSLILLAQLLFSIPSSAASRVFYDTFDGGINSRWTNDDFHNRCQSWASASDGGSPHNGSGMLACNWNGTVDYTDGRAFEALYLPSFSYSNEIFMRAWIRWDHDTAGAKAGPKIFRMGVWPSDTYCAAYFDSGGASCFENGDKIVWWGQGSNLNTSWHKFEFYLRAGTSGQMKIWIDDQLQFSGTGDAVPAGGSWGAFNMSSNYSGGAGCCDHDATNHIYWDEFEIYSDVGTGATGSMSDGTISASSTNSTSSTSGTQSTQPAPPSPPVPY